MELTFEWDDAKAVANVTNHGITFEEGKTVFNDELSITIADPDHSICEDRYIDIGISAQGNLLVVVYTERGPNIRIISCRKATKREQQVYVQREY